MKPNVLAIRPHKQHRKTIEHIERKKPVCQMWAAQSYRQQNPDTDVALSCPHMKTPRDKDGIHRDGSYGGLQLDVSVKDIQMNGSNFAHPPSNTKNCYII